MSRLSWAWIGAIVLTMPSVGMGAAQGAVAQKPAPSAAQKPAPAAQRSAGAGPVVVIETAKGTIEFETYPSDAPKTVEHILALVKRNHYNGLRIHRVVPGFVVQFGDPQTRDMTKQNLWGTQGSGRPIGAAEISPTRKHGLGAVAMAHAGNPARADAQMYITLAPQPRLDGAYAVFGQVISGMDVVRKLQVGDRIVRAAVKP